MKVSVVLVVNKYNYVHQRQLCTCVRRRPGAVQTTAVCKHTAESPILIFLILSPRKTKFLHDMSSEASSASCYQQTPAF